MNEFLEEVNIRNFLCTHETEDLNSLLRVNETEEQINNSTRKRLLSILNLRFSLVIETKIVGQDISHISKQTNKYRLHPGGVLYLRRGHFNVKLAKLGNSYVVIKESIANDV